MRGPPRDRRQDRRRAAAPEPTRAVDVAAVLRRCRDLVDPALRAAVTRLDPTSAAQTAYHLGWVDRDGRPTRGGGKALRPALALLAARACGADETVAVPGGVALELVHNFSLVHDDLIDGDTERRHRPTVWAVWGAPSAILAGDAMLALAQEVLLEVPAPRRRRCCSPGRCASSSAARSPTSPSPSATTWASTNASRWRTARPGRCSVRAPSSAPSSPERPPGPAPRCGGSAPSSAWRSSSSTTCSASGATPPSPASPCSPTCGSARSRCP